MVMAPSAAHSWSRTGCIFAPQESDKKYKLFRKLCKEQEKNVLNLVRNEITTQSKYFIFSYDFKCAFWQLYIQSYIENDTGDMCYKQTLT